jgi:hypothetical protein
MTLILECAPLVLALLASNGSSRTGLALATALLIPSTSGDHACLCLPANGTPLSVDARASQISTGTLAWTTAKTSQRAQRKLLGKRPTASLIVTALALTLR